MRLFVSRLVLISLLCSSIAVAQISFDTPDFATGRGPVWIISGDFNSDGILDLVTADLTGNTISILSGKPDGTFVKTGEYAAPGGPVAVICGDWNKDGFLDLAVVNGAANTVTILMGRGDGTFSSAGDIATGVAPSSIASADFNRDGIADLVVTNAGGNSVSVLLGNGNGTFRRSDISVGDSPAFVSVADLNGDGIVDLAVANEGSSTVLNPLRSVSVLLGRGDGTFMPLPDMSFGSDGPTAIAAADFNGDGIPDMAVKTITCDRGCFFTTRIFLGRGDGTFTAGTEYPAGDRSNAAVADVNHDGKPDLVATGGFPNVVQVLLGNGDGTFSVSVVPAGLDAHSVVTGDFNRDGIPDIATANTSDDTVTVLTGTGDGTFTARRRYSVRGTPEAIATGDFNHDGILDLAVGDNFQNWSIHIYQGRGDGTFTQIQEMSASFAVQTIVVADFNKDGIPDLAFNGLRTLQIALGRGDGTFAPPTTFPTGNSTAWKMRSADINHDGSLDLIFVDFNNAVVVLLGNGDGTFRTPISFAAGTEPVSLAIGDFNGDGNLDIATANSPLECAGNLQIMLGNGDGTFRTGASYFTECRQQTIDTADLNGDGKLDLVIGEGSKVTVLYGHGDGTFGERADYNVQFGAEQVSIIDINGDGRPDIMAGGQRFSVLLSNNAGTFDPAVVFSTGGAGTFVTGDFNGDGQPDVATAASSFSDYFSILLNTTKGTGEECTANSQTVHICLPAANSILPSPVEISGAGNITNQTLLRLYLDNQNIFETHTTSFHQRFNMTPGKHHLVLVGFDNTGTAFTQQIFFTVSGSTACSELPGVHICGPTVGAEAGTSVRLFASANIAHFALLRVYDNNQKVYDTTSHELDINLGLTPGKNHLVLVAYDSTGNAFTAETTVNSSGSGVQFCTVPTDRTINICFPHEGDNTSASFFLDARARWDSNVITHMRVYIDNQPVFDEDTPADGYINPVLHASPGVHHIVVVAWNIKGEVIVSPVQTNTFFL